MSRIKFGANFAVFVIFFGISMLEAFQNGNWLLAVSWLIAGFAFLMADNMKKIKPGEKHGHKDARE